MSNNVTLAFPVPLPTTLSPIPTVDILLGSFSLLCTLIGCPLNLLSFIMFRRQKRSANYLVHMVIALCDSWISFNGIPYALSMLSGSREQVLFGSKVYRTFWAMTWDPFVFFSIYLVLVLSLLRTIKLASRLVVIKEQYVIAALVAYATFLGTRVVVAVIFLGEFIIPENNTYPFFVAKEGYPDVELYLSIACLTFPPIPIIVSALISTFVLRSHRNKQGNSKTRKLRHQATVTVLIFTCLYIACNIPVLLSAIRFVTLLATNFTVDIFNGPTVFLEWYIWPLTYIVLVQTNALLNPLVYIVRMSWFRAGVKQLLITRGLISSGMRAEDTSHGVTSVGRVKVADVVVNPVREKDSEICHEDINISLNKDTETSQI